MIKRDQLSVKNENINSNNKLYYLIIDILK